MSESMSVDVHPALRAALQNTGIRNLPTPSEAVAWSDLTDHVGHLPLMRLQRAGYIKHATRHEARIGILTDGGPGLYHTTAELFRHHYRLTDYRTGDPIQGGESDGV